MENAKARQPAGDASQERHQRVEACYEAADGARRLNSAGPPDNAQAKYRKFPATNGSDFSTSSAKITTAGSSKSLWPGGAIVPGLKLAGCHCKGSPWT